jgi:hypothetical protein
LFGVLGLVIVFCSRFLFRIFPANFPEILIPLWLCWAAAAALQYFGWPSLFRVLLAYGFAARIPVALVMFFAMLGNWGTHYDYVGTPLQFSMPLVPRYLWLAFFPQLVAWVSFTIVLGTLAGVLMHIVVRPRKSEA